MKNISHKDAIILCALIKALLATGHYMEKNEKGRPKPMPIIVTPELVKQLKENGIGDDLPLVVYHAFVLFNRMDEVGRIMY